MRLPLPANWISARAVPLPTSGWTGVNWPVALKMPSQPVWVNHDAILLYAGTPDETGDDVDNADLTFDVIAMRAFPALKAGDLYRAGALIGNPTVIELREAVNKE